jgi:C2 domain
MHCKDGRTLELTAIVSVAPGLLSGYTKVVRIVSRFFVVNSLPYPVRLWQDSSVFRPPGADGARPSSTRRAWRLVRQNSRKVRREVNQYETLWGKEAVIDERSKGQIPGGSRAHSSALYIASLRQSEIAPFTLPDSRGERQLRLDVGGCWNLTASVSADVPGEHTVMLTRAFDLKLTPHVSTRGSPEYIVKMSPVHVRRYSSELGIWFETDWGNDKKVIVKAVKKESFAFQETDVHVGDELLSIDGDPVSRMSFNDAMTGLRTRLTALAENAKSCEQGSGRQLRRSSLRLVGMARGDRSASFGPDAGAPPLVLRFRTVEERLRRVRAKAARASDVNFSEATGYLDPDHGSDNQRAAADLEPRFVKIDLRSVQHSYFLVLKEQDAIPYKILNRSRRSTIYYRQKGCDAHPWQCLGPGNSSVYTWEEPLRAKRLSVRVALEKFLVRDDDSSSDDVPDDSTRLQVRRNAERHAAWSSFLRQVKDEEDSIYSPIVNIRLEEIGFKEVLPFHATREGDESSNARYLELEVEVQGLSRVLVVDDASTDDNSDSLLHELKCLQTARNAELVRRQALSDLKVKSESNDDNIYEEATVIMGTFPGSGMITARHQILVEVIEANGLSTDTFAGSCNPYAEVYMKCANAGRLAWLKKRDRRKTYYITNTVSPCWKGQVFVFDVSPQAVNATRGYSIKICLRDFRPLGQHKLLGAAQVELHSLRDQNSLVGWFPLAGRTGRHELENPLSYWGRGSVKLRLQWNYSPPAYLDYCILLSERRSFDLDAYAEQISQHLHHMQAAEARRREDLDGFQQVRIRDIVARSSRPRKPPQHHAPLKTSTVQPASTIFGNVNSRAPALPHASDIAVVAVDDLAAVVRTADVGKSPVRKTTTLKAKVLAIEALMNKTRQTVSTRDLTDQTGPAFARCGFSGTFSISSFHSWPAAHVVFRDPDLSAAVVGDEVKVRISEAWINRHAASTQQKTRPESPQDVICAFELPTAAPNSLTRSLNAYASSFSNSRTAFELAVERKMKTVIHPGGWLVVRPLTALNLSDAYTGMFVKLRYGAEVVVSETVDAKVNPSWDFSRTLDSDTSQRGRRREALSSIAVNPNDLHVRVPPQKTSGAMILSVVGERRTAKIQSVKELGVLHLPLGATIAACLDGRECQDGDQLPSDTTATYLRWFPLMSPGDVAPVEGDYGLSYRPLESEKLSDTAFDEYFAPCIRLALLWIPDSEEHTQDELSEGESARIDSPTTNTSSNGAAQRMAPSIAPVVNHYIVADIGRISAALIDSQRSFELVSAAASDIEFRFWATKAKTRVGVAIGWLQIDQQHDDAREPVILAPTPSDFIGPVIQVLAVQDNSRSKTEIQTFDFIDLSLEEFDLTLEEKILFDLFDFFRSVKLRKGLLVRRSQHPNEDIDTSQTQQSVMMKSNDVSSQPALSDLLFSCDQGRTSERKVYIEQLFL